ncbi:Uu.00g056180.m01.CDS01 [Anthostomella pinea]|uniref:Uu.00g056180.m01.CDS01 n=1 Tax=Anthostomella pinea TaxID=933095 RepID=A0AAI8VSB7_9PEZI|nr:Uu.00g056180.m01.CDS01 [Anthostomella pinea]
MSLSEYTRALNDSLAKANLVPGSAASLIPAGFTPTTKLDVEFEGKLVELGNFFRAGECKQVPTISFAAEPETPLNATYTFILTDPDAPTPDDPKFAFWRHLVLAGVRPRGTEGVASISRPALTEYLGPGPKDDSKPHRYLFLLYREPQDLALTKEDVGGDEFVQRRSFKPAEFAEKHGLRLVGLNWMTCAGDGWKGKSKGDAVEDLPTVA